MQSLSQFLRTSAIYFSVYGEAVGYIIPAAVVFITQFQISDVTSQTIMVGFVYLYGICRLIIDLGISPLLLD